MTDFRMRLIIETILKDEKFLRQLKKDIEGLDKASKKGSKGLDNLDGSMQSFIKGAAIALAAVVAFGLAAKKAFDLTREGAAINQMTASFELFIKQAGNVPNLLADLKSEAKGTISDFNLMSSTMTLVMGATGDLKKELLEATPQLLEMAKAANKLNPALGSIEFLYESLARGIKRASPLILDNLGVIIKVGEAYQTFADKMGISIKAMSAVQKTQAVLDAALVAGEALISQVGGTTDALTDSWDRLTTNVINSKNALLGWISEAAEPAIKILNEILFGNDELSASITRFTQDVISGKSSISEYNIAMDKLAEGQGKVAITQDELNARVQEAIEGGFPSTNPRSEVLVKMSEDMILAARATAEAEFEAGEYARTVAALREEIEKRGADEFAQQALDEAEALEAAAKATEDYKQAIIDASDAFTAARSAFATNPFANVETGIRGSIQGMIDSQDFANAGGQLIADFASKVNTALFDNKITEPQARVMWEALLLSATQVAIDLGQIDIGAFADDLGISIPAALAVLADAVPLDELSSDLEAMQTKTAATVADLEQLGLSAGLAGKIGRDALDELLSGASETARDVTSVIAREFGIAEQDIAALGGSFEGLTSSAKISETAIKGIATAIGLLANKSITIKVIYKQIGFVPKGDAHGAVYDIPQGFPNDSFFLPLNVQSGEVVTVTPQGKTPPESTSGNRGKGDIHINAPIYLNSEANQTLEEMVNAAIPTRNI